MNSTAISIPDPFFEVGLMNHQAQAKKYFFAVKFVFDYFHLSHLDLLLTKKIVFHSIQAIFQPLEMYPRFGDTRRPVFVRLWVPFSSLFKQ